MQRLPRSCVMTYDMSQPYTNAHKQSKGLILSKRFLMSLIQRKYTIWHVKAIGPVSMIEPVIPHTKYALGELNGSHDFALEYGFSPVVDV